MKEIVVLQKFLVFVLASVFVGLGSGCTAQSAYATGQNYQRSQCMRMLDQAELQRCLRDADAPYKDYKRETGSVSQ